MTRIVMADDDKAFRTVVARFLATLGYAVETVGTGPEALEAIEREAPAMAILDVGLPLLTGDEVAKRLPADLPVLFISGRDLDRVEGLSGDRYRFLRKPADLDEIQAMVEALLAGVSP